MERKVLLRRGLLIVLGLLIGSAIIYGIYYHSKRSKKPARTRVVSTRQTNRSSDALADPPERTEETGGEKQKREKKEGLDVNGSNDEADNSPIPTQLNNKNEKDGKNEANEKKDERNEKDAESSDKNQKEADSSKDEKDKVDLKPVEEKKQKEKKEDEKKEEKAENEKQEKEEENKDEKKGVKQLIEMIEQAKKDNKDEKPKKLKKKETKVEKIDEKVDEEKKEEKEEKSDEDMSVEEAVVGPLCFAFHKLAKNPESTSVKIDPKLTHEAFLVALENLSTDAKALKGAITYCKRLTWHPEITVCMESDEGVLELVPDEQWPLYGAIAKTMLAHVEEVLPAINEVDKRKPLKLGFQRESLTIKTIFSFELEMPLIGVESVLEVKESGVAAPTFFAAHLEWYELATAYLEKYAPFLKNHQVQRIKDYLDEIKEIATTTTATGAEEEETLCNAFYQLAKRPRTAKVKLNASLKYEEMIDALKQHATDINALKGAAVYCDRMSRATGVWGMNSDGTKILYPNGYWPICAALANVFRVHAEMGIKDAPLETEHICHVNRIKVFADVIEVESLRKAITGSAMTPLHDAVMEWHKLLSKHYEVYKFSTPSKFDLVKKRLDEIALVCQSK